MAEYQIKENNGILTIDNVADFNTDHVFDCGQCFRWERNADGSYTGMAFSRPVTISYKENLGQLQIEGASRDDFASVWCEYLDLNRDYGTIKKELARDDEVMAKAIEYGSGIRILNQEKWETLLSFIISQNNNIPRIKKCIESLSQQLGEVAGEYRGKTWYNMPTPEALAAATEEDLAPCRLGYRSKYLLSVGKQVAEDGLESLEKLASPALSSDDTVEGLRHYMGVGPKVANCISLFAMGRIDSFPIDVWVKRVMSQLYGIDESNLKGMQQYARDHFGQWGGIAQQYLFYYITHSQEL